MDGGTLRLAVIADDLTGAGDTGVQLAKAGPKTIIVVNPEAGTVPAADAPVVVFNTASRHAAPDEAYGRVRRAVANLKGAQVYYKKIDSTLRGHLGREIDAVLDETGLEMAVVAPAFPANQRTTVDGVQRVEGIPLAEHTGIRDALSPVTESSIPALLAQQTRRQVDLITRDVVQQGPAAVAAALSAYGPEPRLVVIDAVTTEDLRWIVQGSRDSGRPLLYAGSAGLAEWLPGELWPEASKRRSEPLQPPCGEGRPGLLAVSGTLNDVTVKQVVWAGREPDVRLVLVEPEELMALATGEEVEILRPWMRQHLTGGQHLVVAVRPGSLVTGEDGASEKIARGLGLLCRQFVETVDVGALFLTGGDTALQTVTTLAATALEVRSEVLPGIALGTLVDGSRAGLAVVTKSGGFGSKDALVKVIHNLTGRERGPSYER